MSGFHQRFVGTTAFPKNLTDIDVGLCFRLSTDDVKAIKEKYKDRALGPAVLLVFLRASGRSLEKLTAVPYIVLKYLCAELDINERQIATLRSLYQRAATLTEHRKWVLEHAGLRDPAQKDLDELEAALRAILATTITADDLRKRAEVWLLEHHLLIPSERVVRSITHKASEAEVAVAIEVVHTKIPVPQLRNAISAVFGARKGRNGGTILEWLKEAPGKHGLKSLKEASQKITYLKALGVHDWDISAIGGDRIRAYARAVIHRPPSATRLLAENTQALELSCFLRATLLEFTDNLFYIGGRQINRMIGHGRNRVQSTRAKSATEYAQRETQVRALLHSKNTTDRHKVEALQAMYPEDAPSNSLSGSAVVRDYLAGERLAMGAVLQAFNGIAIMGPDGDDALAQAQALRDVQQQGARELPEGFDASITSKVWHDLINGPDRKRALGALQASTAMAIHKGLRGGTLWIDHSWKHRNREDFLIPHDEWERDRKKLIGAMGLFSDPKLYLKRVRHNVDSGLQAVSEALKAGKLEINQERNVSLPRLSPQDIDLQVTRSRDAIFKIIGQERIENIVIEVDAKSNFSEALLGRRAKTVSELIALYGGIFAMGTENDAAGVAAMIPGVEVSHIAAAMRTLENAERVRQASERVLVFQMEHAIAALWGKGDKGSSDMMALDASNRLFNARVDPWRRTFAVGLYTHVLNSYGVFYDQPIVLNTRQAAAAVHGAHWYNTKQPTDRRLAWLAVDTHGYTNVAMATAKLCGFDLCPQLRNLSERKLMLLHGMELPENMERLNVKIVTEKSILEGWDQAMRVIASIHTGRVSPKDLLERLGSNASGSPVFKALDSLGRLLRTVFLCDYFANESFRREIHTLLNRGESVHQLQRSIYFGRIAPSRGRREDEMAAISGCHALLTNVVIAWNTHRMQEVVDRFAKDKHPIDDDWLAHMGPVHFSGINFRGTMDFTVTPYADALLDRVTRRRQAAG
ncbi:Tn3 family transposase [Hydrogenophaga sp.]|jgi:TnpA family transposase|uniref:Tn3 family transposase n=1 Tax=Hydrogenophaga sp. TaxID=1904254 RepID=UPI003F725CBE